MIYKRIRPQPILSDYVTEYMFFYHQYDKNLDGMVKVLPPLPEHGIEFLPRGLAKIVNKQTGEVSIESKVVIFGYPLFRRDLYYPTMITLSSE